MQIRPFGHCHKKHKMLKMKYKGHHHGCHYKIKGCPSFLETEMHPDFQKKCRKIKKCHKIGKHHGELEGRPCFMKRSLKHHDGGLHRGEHGHHHGPHGHHHHHDGPHRGPHGHQHDGLQREPHGHRHDGPQGGPHRIRDGPWHGGLNRARKNCGCERENESQHFRGHGKRARFQHGGKDCGNCSGNEQNSQAVVGPPCCQERSRSV